MIIKPQIPNPCSENWETMKIGMHSRFCENCKKDVVDFTNMCRQQILEILFSNHHKQICGRIYKSQLDFSHTDLITTINALSRNPKNSNLAFYLLTVGTLTLMSCNKSANKSKEKSSISIDFDAKDDRNEYDLETKRDKHPEEHIDYPVTGEMVVNIDQPLQEKADTTGSRYDFSKLYRGEIMASDDAPYALVDEMPEFIGGISALSEYFKKNLKYPEWERKNKIEGTVYVTFMVDKNGKIKDPGILKGVEGAKNFNQEVIRVISKMPLWKPGKLRGLKVDVQYNLPIKFIL